MKLSRSDLKRLIKPIVREFVEEQLEELLTEGYVANIVQESVLKGDVISHVITEVVKAHSPQVIGYPQQRPVQQTHEQVPQDEVIQRINQLTSNNALSSMLEQRRASYDQQEQQMQQQEARRPPQRQQVELANNKPNWASVASAIPPDDPTVGLTAPVKGTVMEVDNHLNPLRGAQGAGIDTRIISELNPKAMWDKKKLNRFLKMGKIQTQEWKKTNLHEIAKNKEQ